MQRGRSVDEIAAKEASWRCTTIMSHVIVKRVFGSYVTVVEALAYSMNAYASFRLYLFRRNIHL